MNNMSSFAPSRHNLQKTRAPIIPISSFNLEIIRGKIVLGLHLRVLPKDNAIAGFRGGVIILQPLTTQMSLPIAKSLVVFVA